MKPRMTVSLHSMSAWGIPAHNIEKFVLKKLGRKAENRGNTYRYRPYKNPPKICIVIPLVRSASIFVCEDKLHPDYISEKKCLKNKLHSIIQSVAMSLVWAEQLTFLDYRSLHIKINPFLFISSFSWPCCVQAMFSLNCLKGTVSRDFLLLVFFLNQFPPRLWLYH